MSNVESKAMFRRAIESIEVIELARRQYLTPQSIPMIVTARRSAFEDRDSTLDLEKLRILPKLYLTSILVRRPSSKVSFLSGSRHGRLLNSGGWKESQIAP